MIKTVKEFYERFENEEMSVEEVRKIYEELNFACFRKKWKDEEEKTQMYETLRQVQFELETLESY